MSAKIVIVVEYQPNPEHYDDGIETQVECMRDDIKSLGDGMMGLDEFIDCKDIWMGVVDDG